MNNHYVSVKLRDHQYAQCKVKKYDNGDIVFRSYSTDVIVWLDREATMYCTGTYSATTRKQLGWFMREYFGMYYQTAKALYEHETKLVAGEEHPLNEHEKKYLNECVYDNTAYPNELRELMRGE